MTIYDPGDEPRRRKPKDAGPSLFDQPIDQPRARGSDPATSQAAAHLIEPELGKIQILVLEFFRAHGPMTARAAERASAFDAYGYSTVRKRIGELWHSGYLEVTGTDTSRRAPCHIYGASGP
jgi:hypothetical protein